MSATLEDVDVKFLAARLRRLFAFFNYPLPSFAADDARLIGNAAAGIGLLLTAQPAGVPVGDCTEPNRAACPRKCMDFCNKTEQAAAESRGDDAELGRALGVPASSNDQLEKP